MTICNFFNFFLMFFYSTGQSKIIPHRIMPIPALIRKGKVDIINNILAMENSNEQEANKIIYSLYTSLEILLVLTS